jgi:hypothetical protein
MRLICFAAQHRLEVLSDPYLAASVAMKAMALVLRSVPLKQQQQHSSLLRCSVQEGHTPRNATLNPQIVGS